MSQARRPTDAEIIEMIRSIDGYHGNEMKERSKESVASEVFEIRQFLKEWQK
jgi:hypothetical protein